VGESAQELLDRVSATIATYHMLAPGETLLAAVSGGPDSMCLLDVLVALGYRVHLAHFDHQTRDGQSGLDAAFVRDTASRLGLPFHLESRPITQEAREQGASFEAYARAARYSFFRRTADANACTAVVTGHHADDRAETVLMRILRGTWPGGLGAIPPVREDPDGRRVVRPLINCTRREIIAYLTENAISFCTDDSNADVRHLRNRVRHELLPQLSAEYNPRFRDALCRLAELQHDASAVVSRATDELSAVCLNENVIDRVEFARGEAACQRELLVRYAHPRNATISVERIERARRFILEGPQHKYFDFGGGLLLRNERGFTYIVERGMARNNHDVPLHLPGVTEAMGAIIHCRIIEHPLAVPIKTACTPSRQVLDADRVVGPLTLRSRRVGDRFIPLGLSKPKKLKDYFVDRKVPLPLRDRVPLVCANDAIVWVVGHGIDARAAVTTSTRRFLLIEVDWKD